METEAREWLEANAPDLLVEERPDRWLVFLDAESLERELSQGTARPIAVPGDMEEYLSGFKLTRYQRQLLDMLSRGLSVRDMALYMRKPKTSVHRHLKRAVASWLEQRQP